MTKTQTLLRELPDAMSAEFSGLDINVRFLDVGAQFMVSGDLEKVASIAGVDARGLSAQDFISGETYSVRLARDRMLVVSADPAILRSGWNEDGYAVTSMSGALTIIELSGAGTENIVNRATTQAIAGPSPSAAISFAGVNAVLYRHESRDVFRLHLDRGLAPYIWGWLETILEIM